jgi:hypothetical protein
MYVISFFPVYRSVVEKCDELSFSLQTKLDASTNQEYNTRSKATL